MLACCYLQKGYGAGHQREPGDDEVSSAVPAQGSYGRPESTVSIAAFVQSTAAIRVATAGWRKR